MHHVRNRLWLNSKRVIAGLRLNCLGALEHPKRLSGLASWLTDALSAFKLGWRAFVHAQARLLRFLLGLESNITWIKLLPTHHHVPHRLLLVGLRVTNLLALHIKQSCLVILTQTTARIIVIVVDRWRNRERTLIIQHDLGWLHRLVLTECRCGLLALFSRNPSKRHLRSHHLFKLGRCLLSTTQLLIELCLHLKLCQSLVKYHIVEVAAWVHVLVSEQGTLGQRCTDLVNQ